VRHSCEEGYYYAEGCAVGEEDTGGVGWFGMIMDCGGVRGVDDWILDRRFSG